MGLYYPCSENKGADQLIVFAYAKSRFSHNEAQFILQDFVKKIEV